MRVAPLENLHATDHRNPILWESEPNAADVVVACRVAPFGTAPVHACVQADTGPHLAAWLMYSPPVNRDPCYCSCFPKPLSSPRDMFARARGWSTRGSLNADGAAEGTSGWAAAASEALAGTSATFSALRTGSRTHRSLANRIANVARVQQLNAHARDPPPSGWCELLQGLASSQGGSPITGGWSCAFLPVFEFSSSGA